MLGIENLLDHSFMQTKRQSANDANKNEVLRSFRAAKDISSGRFLFRSHLSSGKRYMTSNMLDTQILGRLMIPLVRGKFNCQFCGQLITTFHSVHAEECNAVTQIDPVTNLVSASHDHPTRRHGQLHTEVKDFFKKSVRKIPCASISKKEPVMAEHYNDLGPSSSKSPKKNTKVSKKNSSMPVNTNGDVLSGSQEISLTASSSTPPINKNITYDTRKRADLEIHFQDRERSLRKVVVDVTSGSIHKKTNHKLARVTSGVANDAACKKNNIYEQFTHEGDCIGFGVDSAGGLSDSARKFINDLYAKPKSDEQSVWNCDKDRITEKVRFIDSLSCILARHRAMDIIRMGTKFHSKKIGHRTVQTSSESKDSTD